MTIFDDLTLVRAFVAIVESGSISAAARNLNLTQPTLSRYLKNLEDSCGTELLYRDTHRMQLSLAGQQFLEDARSVLALAEEAQNRLHQNQTTIEGHIRLFSTIDFGQSVVSRLISSFIQANPAITVDLAYSNRALHMLEEGRDVGIVAGHLTDDTVIARSVGEIKRSLCASPELLRIQGVPATPQDLQQWPWLGLSNAQFGGDKVTLFSAEQRRQTLDIKPVLRSEGVTSLREAGRMGLGISVLPDWLIGEDLASGRLVRVLCNWLPVSLPAHIVYPVQRRLPQRVRTFIEFATAYMKAVLV